MKEIYAQALIEQWLEKPDSTKEDYDFMILDYLETMMDNTSIREVLIETRKKAETLHTFQAFRKSRASDYQAFLASLNYQLQFWE